MPGKRDRLVADALHQVAVGAKHEGVVVDDVLAELRRQHPLRERHADGRGDALAKRTRRRLDAGSVEALRMPRRLRMKLAEALQLIERHLRVAGQIKQRIEQHRAVPGGEHKAVAIRPMRIGGIVLQVFREEDRRNISHAHRHAGVAGFGLLDAIHRKCADRVGHHVVIDSVHYGTARGFRREKALHGGAAKLPIRQPLQIAAAQISA